MIESKQLAVRVALMSNGVSAEVISTLFDMDWDWYELTANDIFLCMFEEIKYAEEFIKEAM